MTTPPSDNHWDETTLWAKATLYVRLAQEADRESWQYPFWSALALEFVARSALAHVSPTLLAETSEGAFSNLLYALGKAPASSGIRSVGVSEVLKRCETLVPGFTKDHRTFCSGLSGRRNEELHSGAASFADLKIQRWLPRYCECCKILVEATGRTLVDLLGAEAQAAEQMIKSLGDEAAKEVQKAINAHRTVWQGRSPSERSDATLQATLAASRHSGHRVKCPACECPALVSGEEVSSRDPALEGDLIVVRSTMLPTGFQCTACGLRIEGHARLHASDLGDTYTSTVSWDPVEYYGIDNDYGPEPDFNE